MTTPPPYPPIHGAAVETIAQLLEHERLMSVATLRADGWPQVTTVGYINEGLNLYFVTGRESQKLANLEADPRVSLAIHSSIEVGGAVGVSMAARASEVRDPAEVERLNRLMFARWPTVSVYCPATSSIAIVRLKPELICAISASAGRSKTECFSLGDAAADVAAGPDAVSAEARLF
jgi:general stress protein 26